MFANIQQEQVIPLLQRAIKYVQKLKFIIKKHMSTLIRNSI